MHRKSRKAPGLFLSILLTVYCALAQTPEFVSFTSAQPVLAAMRNALPAELKTSGPVSAGVWDNWVQDRDRKIRVRVEQGEEITLTNLLRLGVTFTKEPRIEYTDLDRYGKSKPVSASAERRADDLVRALAAPRAPAGMVEMRAFLEKKGFSVKNPAEQQKIKAYLLANLARMRDDVIRERSEAKANRFQAFKNRGLSTDSDLYPDFTIEMHLRHMMANGLLKAGSVHRVGIVGPGLDFVNKKFGADFYPPQITQPFAVIDSLGRLGLADPATIELYTFDISPRVNLHLERARKRAASGEPYTVQLLWSPVPQWSPAYLSGFEAFWQKLGDQIGKPATPIPVPEGAMNIRNRAVSIRAGVVMRIVPVDMNVVFQTLPLPPDRRFDLIIGTNIFLYYDALEQSLARVNLAAMIKPDGFLFSNDALPATAPSKLDDLLQTEVPIRPGVSDYMYSYVRKK
jgi:hypothetical protein